MSPSRMPRFSPISINDAIKQGRRVRCLACFRVVMPVSGGVALMRFPLIKRASGDEAVSFESYSETTTTEVFTKKCPECGGLFFDLVVPTAPFTITANHLLILSYLNSFPTPKTFIAPSVIGKAIHANYKSGTSWASSHCRELVTQKYVERSASGYYKITPAGTAFLIKKGANK